MTFCQYQLGSGFPSSAHHSSARGQGRAHPPAFPTCRNQEQPPAADAWRGNRWAPGWMPVSGSTEALLDAVPALTQAPGAAETQAQRPHRLPDHWCREAGCPGWFTCLARATRLSSHRHQIGSLDIAKTRQWRRFRPSQLQDQVQASCDDQPQPLPPGAWAVTLGPREGAVGWDKSRDPPALPSPLRVRDDQQRRRNQSSPGKAYAVLLNGTCSADQYYRGGFQASLSLAGMTTWRKSRAGTTPFAGHTLETDHTGSRPPRPLRDYRPSLALDALQAGTFPTAGVRQTSCWAPADNKTAGAYAPGRPVGPGTFRMVLHGFVKTLNTSCRTGSPPTKTTRPQRRVLATLATTTEQNCCHRMAARARFS